MIVQVQSAQDRLAEPARADQRSKRGCPHANHGARFNSRQNRARRYRQINLPEPRGRTESERNGRFAQRSWNILQPARSVAHDRQQSVKKERGNCRANADTEEGHGNKQREQCQRRDCLHNAGETEDRVPNRTAATSNDAQRNSDKHGQHQRSIHRESLCVNDSPNTEVAEFVSLAK